MKREICSCEGEEWNDDEWTANRCDICDGHIADPESKVEGEVGKMEGFKTFDKNGEN